MTGRASRRRVVEMLGVGLLAWLTAGASGALPRHEDPAPGRLTPAAPVPTTTAPSAPPGPTLADVAPIVLTVDDGSDPEVVAGYVDFARQTGLHLTFCPNGIYASSWEPAGAVLRPLIESGQVQLMNHTYTHPDLTDLSTAGVREELERNEEWITRVFGTTTRPYYRPPFGFHSDRVDAIARDLGWGRRVLWTGSYGDSTLVTPEYLFEQARRYYTPGTIVLGHANHPTILQLFDRIAALLVERGLRSLTLDEFYGTERPSPWRVWSPRESERDRHPPSAR